MALFCIVFTEAPHNIYVTEEYIQWIGGLFRTTGGTSLTMCSLVT